MTWRGHFDLTWKPHLMRGPGCGMGDNALKTEHRLEPVDLGLVLDFSTDLEDILYC